MNTNIRILSIATFRRDCSAIIYSLLGTCKLQGIDPATWLDDVLRRLGDHPEGMLVQLLPQFWKPSVKNATAANSQVAG